MANKVANAVKYMIFCPYLWKEKEMLNVNFSKVEFFMYNEKYFALCIPTYWQLHKSVISIYSISLNVL